MSKRILVVEDQEDLRGMLRDLLSGTRYTVIEAENGERGVASAKSEQPDLILMDIQMPVLDGYEAARRIKADPALKPIPIVAVSSFATKGDEEKARAAGRAQSRHCGRGRVVNPGQVATGAPHARPGHVQHCDREEQAARLRSRCAPRG